MRKRKNVFITVLAVIMAVFAMSVSVCAAQKDPLSQMPKKTSTVFRSAATGMGCDFFTPEYTTKVKITAKSYNTKVVTVKTYAFTRNGKSFAGYETTPKGPGSTQIKVTVKIGSKSYTRTCRYTVYKWENPLKTLKIDSKAYTAKLNRSGTAVLPKNSLNGKFTYKLSSNYKLESIYCYAKKGVVTNIKNGKNLPKGTNRIMMRMKSRKNNNFYNVLVYVAQP